MTLLRALIGVVFFCLLAWSLSNDRRRVPWRVVLWGLASQAALAWFVLDTQVGARAFEAVSAVFVKLIGMTDAGTQLVFGPLAKPDVLAPAFGGANAFILAFQALPVMIFFSALMAVLYHLGIMQVVVWCVGKVMSRVLGVSGAESMSIAADVVCGIEAPLVVKPYVARMTRSELMALMTGGFATIAGSVMGVYMGILGPEYAPHLIGASVMAAPGAFVMAKLMWPERERPETGADIELRIEREASNLVEAIANGTTTGLKLWLNVIAMLIAFVALVALLDWPLGWLGGALGLERELTLSSLFGYAFAPVAWLIGVEGWGDCELFGGLLGTKIALNEFIAYTQLAPLQPGSGAALTFESERAAKMVTYALCGFANFGSIGIQIGGITPLAPERRADIAATAFRAMIAGAMASCVSATIAGVFL
jgi:concentrative nucleoside transporter, CNT family